MEVRDTKVCKTHLIEVGTQESFEISFAEFEKADFNNIVVAAKEGRPRAGMQKVRINEMSMTVETFKTITAKTDRRFSWKFFVLEDQNGTMLAHEVYLGNVKFDFNYRKPNCQGDKMVFDALEMFMYPCGTYKIKEIEE